jgi:hypothetical protein
MYVLYTAMEEIMAWNGSKNVPPLKKLKMRDPEKMFEVCLRSLP